MAERTKSYFVADVHLGLRTGDPAEREQRFVKFLKDLDKPDTKALWLLGDIWDFWYEYRDVVPREGAKAVAALISLMDKGIEVHFCEGNHDIWSFSFFEELGMQKFSQPYFCGIGGKTFCLGHGDGLGDTKWNYRLMLRIFHSKIAQALFSTLHPWLAYRFGLGWSNGNRRTHAPYQSRGVEEPLYKYAVASERKADYFVFGHFHIGQELELPDGGRLVMVKDWMDGGAPHGVYDENDGELRLISF